MQICYASNMTPPQQSLRDFSTDQIEEIIKLAWADTIPFETIRLEYGLTENQIRKFMRIHQPAKTYIRWRERVETRSGASSKHLALSTKSGARIKGNT